MTLTVNTSSTPVIYCLEVGFSCLYGRVEIGVELVLNGTSSFYYAGYSLGVVESHWDNICKLSNAAELCIINLCLIHNVSLRELTVYKSKLVRLLNLTSLLKSMPVSVNLTSRPDLYATVVKKRRASLRAIQICYPDFKFSLSSTRPKEKDYQELLLHGFTQEHRRDVSAFLIKWLCTLARDIDTRLVTYEYLLQNLPLWWAILTKKSNLLELLEQDEAELILDALDYMKRNKLRKRNIKFKVSQTLEYKKWLEAMHPNKIT